MDLAGGGFYRGCGEERAWVRSCVWELGILFGFRLVLVRALMVGFILLFIF